MDTIPSRSRTLITTVVVAAIAALGLTFVLGASSQEAGAVTGDVSIPISPVHFLTFGDPGVFDDCVYAEMQGTSGATAVAPSRFDFRYTPCLSAPGMMILGDNDRAETGYVTGDGNTAPVVTVRYADNNGNAVYNADETLYLGTGSGTSLDSSTGPTSFTIRLTAAGPKAAGTFVFSADQDRIASVGRMVALTPSLAWFDKDATTTFTAGDSLYLLPTTAPGLAKGSIFPTNSVKLYPAAATSSSSSSSSAASTTSTRTTTSTTSSSTTTSSETPTITSLAPRTRAPGFEAMFVMAGLAGAMVWIARRRA